MTDHEYFAIVATFTSKFVATQETCELVNPSSRNAYSVSQCKKCPYDDSSSYGCKLDPTHTGSNYHPDFLAKVLVHHPEVLL
jgi:hypothetical protein